MELEVRLDQSFLAGHISEYGPKLIVRGNWPEARDGVHVALEDGMAPVTITLPAPRLETFNDDVPLITSVLMAKSQRSGQPELDKVYMGKVELTIPCAGFAVPATDLVGADWKTVHAVDHFIATDRYRTMVLALSKGDGSALTNPAAALGQKQAETLEQLALGYAHKGTFSMRCKKCASLDAFAERMPVLTEARRKRCERAIAFMQRLEQRFLEMATDLPVQGATMPRFTCNPTEKLLTGLHLVQWDTPLGRGMPISFARRHPAQERGLPAVDLQFVEQHVSQAILRVGLRPSRVVELVDEFLASAPDAPLRTSMLTVIEALTSYATFTANAVNYASDRRYPNYAFLDAQPKELRPLLAPELYGEGAANGLTSTDTWPTAKTLTPPGQLKDFAVPLRAWVALSAPAMTASAMAVLGHGTPFRANHSKAHKDMDLPREERGAIVIDDWSPQAFAGDCNADDCEDGGFGTRAPIEALRLAARQPGASKCLRAMGALLGLYEHWATGSSVTTPYLKAKDGDDDDEEADGNDKDDGWKAARKVPPRKPMPVPGSEEDERDFREAGHALGAIEPRRPMLMRVKRGLAQLPPATPGLAECHANLDARIAATHPASDRLPSALFEGTAPMAGWVLPYEEVLRGTDREHVGLCKAAAKMAFVRRARTRVSDAYAAINKLGRLQSQPSAFRALDKTQQRVSMFYRAIDHLICVDLADDVSPMMGQLLAVTADDGHRGVLVGDYLRAHGERTADVALVPPYAGIAGAEWTKEYAPYEAQLLRDNPPTVWGRQRNLPLAAIGVPLGAGMDATGEVSVERFAAFEVADERDDRVVLPLMTPKWLYDGLGADGQERVRAALETLKRDHAIVDYLWLSSLPMAHLDTQLELLLLLPVGTTPDELVSSS